MHHNHVTHVMIRGLIVCLIFAASFHSSDALPEPSVFCTRGAGTCTTLLCETLNATTSCVFAPLKVGDKVYIGRNGSWKNDKIQGLNVTEFPCAGGACCLTSISAAQPVEVKMQLTTTQIPTSEIAITKYEKCFQGQVGFIPSVAYAWLNSAPTECLNLTHYCNFSATTPSVTTTSVTTTLVTTASVTTASVTPQQTTQSDKFTTTVITVAPTTVIQTTTDVHTEAESAAATATTATTTATARAPTTTTFVNPRPPVYLPQLSREAVKLNPASVEDLEKIENFVDKLSRNITATNKINVDHGHAQLYIELIKQNQSEYNFNRMLGTTYIDFTLQTNGVNRFVIAVFVFKINKTGTAQTQPIKAGSLTITRYIATLNTTYIVIVGWNADSFLNSESNKTENNQLPGNISFVVPPTPLESICKEMAAESQNTSNLVINKLEPICLYYDTVERRYSDRGCVTITDDVTSNVTCKCNHLTVFTVLLAVQSTTIPEGVKITSYTTESASVMFLIATIIILYKSKHRGDRVPVQINLSVALLLFHALNLSHDLAIMHEISCVTLAANLQYLLLCAGFWFLVEGVRLFMATSCPVEFRTQDSSTRLKIFMLIGWIIPALIVGISMAVGFSTGNCMKPQPFHEKCNEFFPIPKYDRCWLAPGTPIFYVTVISPLALVLLINFMIILKTTHVMLHSRKMRNRGEDPGTGDALRAAKSFILLFLMLGGTWILAFFTGIGNEISNEFFMYFNSLVNGSQGIVVFLLYCVMDDDIRQEILPCKREVDIGSKPQVNAANAANAKGGESSNN